MRRLGTIIIALYALAAASPARALGDLKNCDAIQNAGERMSCLYAHITHLEQTLLSLSTDITDLRHALKDKLDAKGVYKLQYVGKGSCLIYAEKDKPPAFASCDRPDSWKLVRGSQSPAKPGADSKTPSRDEAGKSADKPRGKDKDKDKDKSKGKTKDKPQADSTPPDKATVQPKTAPAEPQPN